MTTENPSFKDVTIIGASVSQFYKSESNCWVYV